MKKWGILLLVLATYSYVSVSVADEEKPVEAAAQENATSDDGESSNRDGKANLSGIVTNGAVMAGSQLKGKPAGLSGLVQHGAATSGSAITTPHKKHSDKTPHSTPKLHTSYTSPKTIKEAPAVQTQGDLQYWVELYQNGVFNPVSSSHVFHNQDIIRFAFVPQKDGLISLMVRTSDNKRKLLYPKPHVDNSVQAKIEYKIPDESTNKGFTIDGQAGRDSFVLTLNTNPKAIMQVMKQTDTPATPTDETEESQSGRPKSRSKDVTETDLPMETNVMLNIEHRE